ncbi:MAG TPA: RNA polymerase factor sigma-54 [Myxococcota bacterium]|nr:RNA polymerase factor sigma-54 [Myxococcota bacterium]
MAIELKQQLKLSQSLVMTPQLQQAIKLLQLSQLELVASVQQELEQNPVLEELTEGEEEPIRDNVAEAASEVAAEQTTELEAPAQEGATEAAADKLADIDWQSYADAYPQTSYGGSGGGDDERRSFEATATKRESLQDHLTWQLQLSSMPEEDQLAASWVIGNLDDNGYLQSPVEEIARQSGAPPERVEAAIARIQKLDPPGIAARDLRESLLLQLDALHIKDPLVRVLVSEHLGPLQKREFKALVRDTGATIEEIAAAAHVIGNLEPRPGRAFGGEEPIYIVPDIYVHKIGDDYHVVLNEDGLPKLKLNALYRDVLAKSRDVAKDTREYVQERVRSALWLIKSIHQRQRTIYKVMESIVRFQREFFDRGIAHLKPLNLRDVADDIGMHESTVSRVTTNKYCHTPQGIFELKYFFNSSIARVDGDAIASESVKERIRKLISAEDPKNPLSDQRIAEILKGTNIDIARRTVTKYREAMNILSSTQRRAVG